MIAAGAEIELKTMHGEKPIDIARRYHHEQLVTYLQWIGKGTSMDSPPSELPSSSDSQFLDPADQRGERVSR